MDTYTGKSIFNGIAIGRILFYKKGEQAVTRVKVQDVEAEVARYERAKCDEAAWRVIRKSSGRSRRSKRYDFRGASDDA